MRIARAGETPTDDAALVNAVVLNGPGGLRVLRFDSTDLTTPGDVVLGKCGLGLLLLPELVHLVVRGEHPVGMLERGPHFPEGLGHVRAPLQLALDDDRKRRALHAADGQELRAEAAGRERHEPRQRRAPDQVDVLARLTGAGQRLRQLDEVGERLVDLLLREGGVPRALDAGREADVLGQLRVRVEDLLERLEADQLALAVVVGRDHHRVGVLRLLAQCLVDVLLDGLLDQLGVDQLARLDLAPFRITLRERGVHEVALEADHTLAAVLVLPAIVRNAVAFVLLGLASGQDLGDLLGAVVFFCDDQLHCNP